MLLLLMLLVYIVYCMTGVNMGTQDIEGYTGYTV